MRIGVSASTDINAAAREIEAHPQAPRGRDVDQQPVGRRTE
jgi:hypothetical protein